MKGICSIILLISITAAFAGYEESKAVIWYDGANFYKHLSKKDEATVYFDQWDASTLLFLKDKNFKVALQLNRQLDPIPNDSKELPDITTLSAVQDQSVIDEYLSFLEKYGRANNVDYLVLPDTSGLSRLEKLVLEKANQKSPFYFIPHGLTTKSIPSSRKALADKPVIWIVDQAVNTSKLSRWSKKLTSDFHKAFAKKPEVGSVSGISGWETLISNIYRQAVVAIDPNELLPINSGAVVYLGQDQQLRGRLEQYVTVYDRPQAQEHPVILDRRFGSNRKIFGNEIVIDYNSAGTSANGTTTLRIPKELDFDKTIIAKMLFGAQEISGRTDDNGNRRIQEQGFIGYSDPTYEEMDETELQRLETYIEEAIQGRATPGSQLAVVKNGSVVLEKSYGYFTYDSLKQLLNTDIFDLASLTKVVATLPAIALLVDQKKINLEDSIGMHLEAFRESNKSHVTIKQLLAHNGGIRSYIPFWRRAMTGDRLDSFYYKNKLDEENDIRSYGIEPHPALSDSMKSWIQKSELIKNQEKYNYSDLGYMILHMVVEAVSGQPFDVFLDENFYEPMRLNITFNPRKKGYGLENIVPTEYDERYRKDQVWGEVHDRNAHAFGGVSGHAGLFSNSLDLAKMMFMLSNGGFYQGEQYLKTETLNTFNVRYFDKNRRGLGWDKKDGSRDAASVWASDSSFGHTGFTGTMVWADPENDLIFVFLSNRIYPDANNARLMKLNTRTEIHDVIYESILND